MRLTDNKGCEPFRKNKLNVGRDQVATDDFEG